MSIINIIAEDNVVIIDGDAEDVIFTGNSNIHAIHWDDVALTGEVEYKNKPAEAIDDFTPYQHFIADHGASKSAKAQTKAEEVIAIAEARQAENDAVEGTLTQTNKRKRAYPSASIQLQALRKARRGNTFDIDALDAAMDAIDVQFPL